MIINFNTPSGFFHHVPHDDIFPHNLSVDITDGEAVLNCYCKPEITYKEDMDEDVVSHRSFDLSEMCKDNDKLFPVITKINYRGQKNRIVAE